MSENKPLQRFLASAKAKEDKCDWTGAVNFYRKALGLKLKREGSECIRAEIRERVGYNLFRAAFQVDTAAKFKTQILDAVEEYENAASQYTKASRPVDSGYCRALAKEASLWVAPSSDEKRILVDECVVEFKNVAAGYEKEGNHARSGKAYNRMLGKLLDRFDFEDEWSRRKEFLAEGLKYGEKTIAIFQQLKDSRELTLACYQTGLFYFLTAYYGDVMDKNLGERGLELLEEALKLSERTGDPYLIALSNSAAVNTFWMVEDLTLALSRAEKALQKGVETKDNLLVGTAFSWLASTTYWMAEAEENPDKKREMYTKIIEYTRQARTHFNPISSNTPISQVQWAYVESLALLAWEVETDRHKKRFLLEKAIANRREDMANASKSGQPESIAYIAKSLSRALYFLSYVTTGAKEREALLKEALMYANKNLKITEQAFPFWRWYRGVGQSYQASIIAEQAKGENDPLQKKKLLQKARRSIAKGVEFCKGWTTASCPFAPPGFSAALGRYYEGFGKILDQLHQITGNSENLREKIEAHQGAIETYRRANMPSRVAENYWQNAKVRDQLGEHWEAAGDFESASIMYSAAADKNPHLRKFYTEYSSYMKAWSEIEKAKHHHARQSYGEAQKHYEEAARLHKMSESWAYLSPNYLAWAQLEQGETLSREEQSREAIRTFQKASELFAEAERTLRVESDKTVDEAEKKLVKMLVKASNTRERYCQGRVALEEARILDRQGDQLASSERYGSAAKTFQGIMKAGSIQIQRELKPLTFICQAWQKMMMAEAKASSTLYGEAAALFNKAKEYTLDERTSLLASANSSFCRALKAGTEFEVTRDFTLHSTAIEHLESAANYYVKAGYTNASEYARAAQRLFDAYIYMDNAKKETDPEKKARYYMMAEKVLEAASESYKKAKHLDKSMQAKRLLEKIREERELALSLSEVLHAPTIASSTTSFATPTPREESAVGLARFETANIQANIQHASEVRVGEDFNLEIQIVNVAKDAVLLVKIEGIPPVGFEPVSQPDYCRFEETYVDMKGRRLNPLKTEEIKFVLRAFEKGTFELQPRIVYADKTGRQMFFEPQPTAINVSQVVLPGRVATGYRELDSLLLGGLPKNFGVVLTSPSCDERDVLVRRFLETGAKEGQTTFFVTSEAGAVADLAQEYRENFYLIICNPQADKIVQTLPNTVKLKGVENLTEIGIALTSAFRKLTSSASDVKRACIDIVSDVLLQHHAVNTRRWLAGLLPQLKSRGFTTLGVVNPQMHFPPEVHAILGLFEGEITIDEREGERGTEKFLAIKKMANQRYLESELPLKKKRLRI